MNEYGFKYDAPNEHLKKMAGNVCTKSQFTMNRRRLIDRQLSERRVRFKTVHPEEILQRHFVVCETNLSPEVHASILYSQV